MFGRNWFLKYSSEFVRKLRLGQAILFLVEISNPNQMFWNSGCDHCWHVLATCLLPLPPQGPGLLQALT